MNKTSVLEPEAADRYLAYIPEHLRQKYQEGLADRKITILHQEIALLDVRIKTLVEQLEQEILEPGDIALEITTVFPEINPNLALEIAELVWTYAPENFIDYTTFKRLNQLVKAYRRAIKDVDKEILLRQLFAAIEDGERTGDLWHEIQGAMEQRRKLVEIEERRIERTKQTLTVQQVVLIVEVVINSIKAAMENYVSDQATQKYILADAEHAYNRLLTFGDDPAEDKQRVDRGRQQ